MQVELVFTSEGEYARDTHDCQDALELALGALYNVGSNARLAPSGIAAIASVLHSFLQRHPDGVIWTLDELYDETLALLETLPHRRASLEDMIDATHPTLLLIEACSNPHGRLPDYERIAALKSAQAEFYLVVDNTWLSAAVCNPFRLGADLVVTSLTKYYSGGSAIAGAVLGASSALFINAADWLSLNGQHVSPYNCARILDQLPQLDARVQASSARTLALLEALQQRGLRVHHPLAQQRQQAERCFRHVDGALRVPSVLLIDAPLPSANLPERTSYGGKEDRIERYDASVRVALGYESPLSTDQLLAALNL